MELPQRLLPAQGYAASVYPFERKFKMPGNAYSLDKCARIKIREKNLKSKLQKWGITLCIERSFACSASARSKKKLPQVEKPELLSAEARKIFFYDKNAGVLPHAKTQSVLKQLID